MPPLTCKALPAILVVVNAALLITIVAVVVPFLCAIESRVLVFHNTISP